MCNILVIWIYTQHVICHCWLNAWQHQSVVVRETACDTCNQYLLMTSGLSSRDMTKQYAWSQKNQPFIINLVHYESTQTERTDLISYVLWSTVSHHIVMFIVTQKLFVAGIFISVTPAENIVLDCENQGSLSWIWSKKLTCFMTSLQTVISRPPSLIVFFPSLVLWLMFGLWVD